MANRRAFLTLVVAAGMALSARGASAASSVAAPSAKTRIAFERPATTDGSVTSLVRLMRDRLTVVYRDLRGARIVGDPRDGTGYRTDGLSDGPEGMDPLGAKGGLHGATPAQTQRPGS